MEKLLSFLKRKTFLFGSVLVLCFVGFFAFRYPLMNSGIKLFLRTTLPNNDQQKVQYQTIRVEKERVLIRGLHCTAPHYDLTLDRIEFSLPNLWKNIFTLMRRGNNFPLLLSLLAEDQKNIKLDIDHALLNIQGEKYYLQYKSSQNPEEIGTFFIFSEPNLLEDPFLKIHWISKENNIIAQVQVEKIPTKQFFHFLSLVFPELAHQISNPQGMVEVSADARFSKKGDLIDFSSHISSQNLEVFYPELQAHVAADKIDGDLQYKPERQGSSFWQKMVGVVSVDKGKFALGEPFVLTDIQGVVSLDSPNSVLNLKGLLATTEGPLDMMLQSNESMQKNRVNAFKMILQLKDQQGTECNTSITACHGEKGEWNIQLDADQLFHEQISLLKTFVSQSNPDFNLWEITKGIFGGKAIAQIEKGQLVRLELEKFWGQNVEVTFQENPHPIFLHTIKGQGEWTGWYPKLLGELDLNIVLPTAHLLYGSSTPLFEIFEKNPLQGNTHISTKLLFKNEGIDTQGSILLEDPNIAHQSLQFGIITTTLFPKSFLEVKEGWLCGTHLSEKVYSPVIQALSPDLELHGELEFVATYDGKQVDSSFFIQDFLAKQYFFDVKADCVGANDFKKIQNQVAKIFYYPESGEWEGKIPLVNAMFYDKRLGLLCTNLMAEIAFSLSANQAEVRGTVQNGDLFFDGNPLLKKTQFSFALANEEVAITDFSSGLFLPTDRDIRLTATNIFLGEKQSNCNIQLYDGKQLLVQFEGMKGDQWLGKLVFGPELPISGTFAVQCAFDPLQELFTFDAETSSLTLMGRELGKAEAHFTKLGKDFYIDKISWDQYVCKSYLSPEKDNWLVKDLEISRPEMSLKAEGKLTCDLPSSTQNLLVKADLNMNIEILQPVPLQFKTDEPVKIAFSPEMGLVISHLELSANSGKFSLEQGEYLFLSNKASALNCHFSFNEEILSAMIKGQLLPEIVNNLYLFKHFSGNCNFSLSPEEKKIVGSFDHGVSWHAGDLLPLQFEALVHDTTLFIQFKEDNIDESLNIQGKWDLGKLLIEKINGKLGPIAVSLKNAKGLLKGGIDIDFASIASLFELPVNSWISLWNLGKGFRVEGEFTPHTQLQDWEFKGKIKGKDCICAGYPLQAIEAKIELQPGHVTIENLDVSDESGKLWINDGVLSRNGNQWMFSFPLIEIRNLQPHTIQRAKGIEKLSSYLMIKTASLTDVRGMLDKLSSITAQGNLRFSTKEKDKGKLSLLKNLPKQLLQKMGLDENLLAPIGGEIDFSIRDGKIFLQSLKGVQSDKKKSEFFLPKGGEPAYLDFQGNLFLNIKMRQFVLPTLTEPISVNIRGTWNEPELSIK